MQSRQATKRAQALLSSVLGSHKPQPFAIDTVHRGSATQADEPAGPGPGSSGSSSSVDAEEVKKFARLSSQWWDKGGAFGPLHSMNSVRCRFIHEGMSMLGRQVENADKRPPGSGYQPLQGIRVLDVGCGGGILSEGLARLGAHVTGIDVVPENIHVAASHVERDPWIKDRVTYRHISAEDLVAEGAKFDAVVASEVIEHVKNPADFARTLTQLAEPSKGLVFISTLDRTNKSFLTAIMGAEYLTGLVPRGTHDWLQFIRPAELDHHMDAAGMVRRRMTGLRIDPLTWQWSFSGDTSVNYMSMYAWKPRTTASDDSEQPDISEESGSNVGPYGSGSAP